ncbi:glycoside hydrolase [Hypomontagnella submonticulosa]|nr:glycoside hydrolase [Hypomontagnella submonticulosa]
MVSATVISLALLPYLRLVAGHYPFPYFIKNGVSSEPWEFVRRSPAWPLEHFNDSNWNLSPLFDPYSTDVRCGEKSLKAAPETKVAQVKAGDEIGFGLFPNKTVYHPGPLTMWLSKADGNISEYDGSGYWFKTYETGVTWDPEASPAYYRLHWDASYITQFLFKVPETTPPGQYLLRIAHDQVTHTFNTTQRFVNCAQIEIEGTGGGSPTPLVRIPNPAMMFDRGQWIISEIYDSQRASAEAVASYHIPYEAVWKG